MGLGAFLLLFTPLLQGFFGSSQSVLAGEKRSFTFTYNGAWALAQESYPDKTVVVYAYNLKGFKKFNCCA